ncbi:glycosyltransferase family 9 protein [Biostraticola tofi]|uniref:ADP-heptose:LPS heptosyltransferase n=1 Tax=Biostraticola tofi TaxID=466109 RepID=A0A4R3YRX5_9GAMM|nr:glycosyltransferase family 9 protein [Biostraticola tofi]TCV95116.1 ADP-heptose:LPS heptosyltransferase [Biostraticola tofi]
MAFQHIRTLNRRKNVYLKKIKLDIKLFFLDKLSRSRPHTQPERMNIIILCNGFGIGDAIVTTGLIFSLHQHGHTVTVLCEKRTAFIFEYSPAVEHVVIYDGLRHLRSQHRSRYDLLIDINEKNHLSPLRFRIIKALKPAIALGINQSNYNIYDVSVYYRQPLKHISNKHQEILHHLGLAVDNYSYHLTVPENITLEVKAFISQLDSDNFVVINPFASELSRDMSDAQIETLTKYILQEIGKTVIFIGTPCQLERITVKSGIKFPSATFLHAAALIESAKLVISPDTSIVHLCKIYDKKLVCLYNNKIINDGEQNNIVWGPGYSNAMQILSTGNRIDDISADVLCRTVLDAAIQLGWTIPAITRINGELRNFDALLAEMTH